MVTTVVFNLNPLMRYDGYYMLSDFLEIPNLSDKSRKLLQNAFARHCLGIETREEAFMPQRGKEWLVTYAIASTVYRWIVLFGITLFLYTVLKPYDLQSIGVTLAWCSLAGIVSNLVVNVWRTISAPRSKPLSRTRIAVSLGILGSAVAAALAIPLPLHVEAPFLIEPHEVAHIYNAVPGKLAEVRVRPGAAVSKGDILLVLADPDKAFKYRELATQARAQQVEVDRFRASQDSARLDVAREQLKSLESQLADYEKQLEELTIVAPCDGTVISIARVSEPKQAPAALELHGWYGTPLDRQNIGSLIEPRTQLCSIAPDSRFQAVLMVDQADRGDVETGDRVEIKFDHLPAVTYEGTVGEISEHHVEFAPSALSNKSGGTLATVTDPKGREKLASIAYEAKVLLDEEALLRAGMRGNSRFSVGHRSAWQWTWRWLRHTFHFRL
jgi:putative peptide zinc metalloprotease protein